MDFVCDTFGASRKFHILAVNDDCCRENLCLMAAISIENARKLAITGKGQIATGANPQKDKRAVRDEMTLAPCLRTTWRNTQRYINGLGLTTSVK
ncbi:MAG: hypothetical protein COB16_03325 [Rhodobacteraceae bacterium]|nr:MAG: hypothetical protein COB16_03325 [Paracoccaceae bacterium]